MFNKSKYTVWYFSIVEKSKNRIVSGYTERHHVIPKCLNGMYGKKLSPETIAKRTATRKVNRLMQEMHRA